MQYSIRAVAMATGVSESRLRTWERRYGVPRPDRTQSGRRRFDETDLASIRRMAALIDAGMAASEAAEAVLSEAGNGEPDAHLTEESLHPLADLLVRKALEFDDGWVRRILHDSTFASGWLPTLERVAFPALRRLNDQWTAGTANTAHMRFAHELVCAEVQAELARLGTASGPKATVMIACAEDESCEVAALGLALALRPEGIRPVYLGHSVPSEDLVAAARQLAPSAICLLGTRRANPGKLGRTARALVSNRVPGVLYIGGSVLTRRDAPEIPGVHLPMSLTGAAERLVKALARG